MKGPSVQYLLSTCICISIICAESARQKDTVIGEIYELAGKGDSPEQGQAKGALTIQSATAASQASTCNNDAECLALCPSSAFTQAQPRLTSAVVEQQLAQCANAMRTSPNSFAALFNGVCNYADFQADVTSPKRPPFVINDALSAVAEAHSNDMGATNFFHHYSQNSSSPADRIKATFPSVSIVSELIAAGWTDVRSLMLQFMCSAKHRNVLMSCSYDTLGFGATFSGSQQGLPASAQWPSYFTADLACSIGASCTCTSTPQVLQAVTGQPALGTAYTSAQPQVSFTATFTSLLTSALQPDQITAVAADVISAMQAYVAPTQINVTSSQLGVATPAPGSARRRLLQTVATQQATVSFNLAFTSAPADTSATALQADVSAALTQYIESTPVQITYTPAAAGSGTAFIVSVQLPPNNQLSTEESYGTQLALSLAHDLENNPDTVLAAVISKDGPVAVTSTQTQDKIVQAVAATNLLPAAPLPTLLPLSPGSSPSQSPASPSPVSPPSQGPPGQSPPMASPSPASQAPQGPPPSPQGSPTMPPLVASSGSAVQVAQPYVKGSANPPTLQSSVTATLTLTNVPSSTAPGSALPNIISSDITAYVGGAQPLVTVTPDTSGPNLALNMTAVYPTNSQFSDSVDTGSQQASSLAAGMRSSPASVFLGLIAKQGPVTVSNLATVTKVVQAGGAAVPSAPLVAQTPSALTTPSPAGSTPVPVPVPTPSSTPGSPVSTSPQPSAGTSTSPSPVASSSPANGPASSTGPVIVPSVTFTLTFSNLAPSSVTDPKPYQIGVAKDIEAYVTSAQLAKLTELPLAGTQNWALNVTVNFRPDGASEVSQATARAQALADALQASPEKVFTSTVASSGPVVATDVQTLVRVATGATPTSPSGQAASPQGSMTYVSSPSQAPPGSPGSASPASSPVPASPSPVSESPVSSSPVRQSPTPTSPSPSPAGAANVPALGSAGPTLQTVTFTLVLTDISAGGHATDVQGYITDDVLSYVGSSPPLTTSYMEDNSGQNLALNVTVAFPGTADRSSQQFADTQTAAQALATAINIDPGSVFKTLIAKNVHGKASNVQILGPSSGTPTGPPAAPAAAPPSQETPPAAAAAPTSAPTQLTLSFTATFPAAAQAAALNLSSALQTNPAAVLQPVTVKHGPLTLSGVLVTQGSTSSAIESYSGAAATPAIAPEGGITPLATVPNPFPAGIAASNASYKQLSNATRLYAINMQFSNGAVQSDKINNMLLLAAGAASAAAPTPDNFAISLLKGAPAGITAIVPYAAVPNLYFVQVSTPPDYTGPVTVSYSAAASTTSVSFTILTQLAVKITACSFSA